ncbi:MULTISPECIES: universal stress protein [unclassified Sedimentibacter]|uniref:universal stress protein n=1 Tax=unclassified Sedimentibacter TaxID=2649220 RepID=UPI0027E1032A|nr:universal stress protein [Sedimentibacter sp. MB35-C1]WMJ78890.1 universal stress protein [Sedimentibacter sp. MB35-C1]
MKKILVPVDGSNASISAVKKAIELGRQYNSEIKLLSVVKASEHRGTAKNENLWSAVDGSAIVNSAELEDKLESKYIENSETLLKQIVTKLDFRGTKVETEVLTGDPFEKIIETAQKGYYDLIVMGNRGFSKIKRFFVGSVTQKVISESPCPVLVIRSSFEP